MCGRRWCPGCCPPPVDDPKSRGTQCHHYQNRSGMLQPTMLHGLLYCSDTKLPLQNMQMSMSIHHRDPSNLHLGLRQLFGQNWGTTIHWKSLQHMIQTLPASNSGNTIGWPHGHINTSSHVLVPWQKDPSAWRQDETSLLSGQSTVRDPAQKLPVLFFSHRSLEFHQQHLYGLEPAAEIRRREHDLTLLMTPQAGASNYSHLASPTGQLGGEVPRKVLQQDMLTQQPPRYASTTQWAPHRGSNPGGTSNRRRLQRLLHANPCTSTLLCLHLRDFHQRQPILPRLLLHSLGQSRTTKGSTHWPTRTIPGSSCDKLFPIRLAPSLLLRTLRTKHVVPSLPILLIRHLRK